MTVARSSTAWTEGHRLLKRYRRALAISFALVLVSRLAALVIPTSTKYILDDVIVQRRTTLLVPIAIAAVVAVVLDGASSFEATRRMGLASQRAVAELRHELYIRLLRFPARFFDRARSGELVARVMGDVEQLRYLVGNGLALLVSNVLTALLAFLLLFALNPALTAGVMVVLVGFGLVLTTGFRRTTGAFRVAAQSSAVLSGRLAETIGGIGVIKASTAERREAHRFVRESHRALRAAVRTVVATSALGTTTTVATGIVGALVLAIGALAVVNGRMTAGDVMMYVALVGLLWMPLVQLSAIGGEVGRTIAALSRIAELRSVVTEDEEDHTRHRPRSLVGNVSFRAVTFGYRQDVPVIREISFEATAGSTTALVGPTGSGKTTTCALLAAFYEPWTGRILIDGRDLAFLHRREYRRYLGFVAQDPILFEGTIRENIAYGDPGATQSEVYRAARLAHCLEFIDRLPESFDTWVSERGLSLSGGQRQRLAIARAMLADPRILILDEPTSQLDLESDLLVQQALRELQSGRTTLVIAHRLSTIRTADQILVFDAGAIVERGTHRELVSKRGRYYRLDEAQGHNRAGAVPVGGDSGRTSYREALA